MVTKTTQWSQQGFRCNGPDTSAKEDYTSYGHVVKTRTTIALNTIMKNLILVVMAKAMWITDFLTLMARTSRATGRWMITRTTELNLPTSQPPHTVSFSQADTRLPRNTKLDCKANTCLSFQSSTSQKTKKQNPQTSINLFFLVAFSSFFY